VLPLRSLKKEEEIFFKIEAFAFLLILIKFLNF